VETCLAVDIGGTKLASGLVTRSGELLTRRQVPTPPNAQGEELFTALEVLIHEVVGGGGSSADRTAPMVCGVGCGGPMEAGGSTVSPLNIPGWRSFPLHQRLAASTGLLTAVDNDAKALALGERWLGAARGHRNFLAMVVSTGVGGGIVLDGRLLHGASGNAGHIGHVVVEPDGRRCACGGRGCLEAEASGSAIAAITGAAPALASAAVIERTGRLVGRAVASVCNLLDIPLAVVGGSVALGFGAPFFEAAAYELASRARLSFSRSARILPAGLAESGPLIGAAAVGWSALDAGPRTPGPRTPGPRTPGPRTPGPVADDG
jgi:glucokinase